jgi:response regulator RpfG family c-di-GMP phosphodiesterase
VFCKAASREVSTVSATILVVDDDPVTVTLAQRTLGPGATGWTAGSAAEARQVLQELAGAVDLVLTDISMPGGLGLRKPFAPGQLLSRSARRSGAEPITSFRWRS